LLLSSNQKCWVTHFSTQPKAAFKFGDRIFSQLYDSVVGCFWLDTKLNPTSALCVVMGNVGFRRASTQPINHDSGQHKGKRMINGGRAHVRATLYMGAVVAMRHNPIIKAFYERLVERGKSKKLALTACVHKMLIILNAMVRDNLPWCIRDNFKPIVNA
jgi:transposase